MPHTCHERGHPFLTWYNYLFSFLSFLIFQSTFCYFRLFQNLSSYWKAAHHDFREVWLYLTIISPFCKQLLWLVALVRAFDLEVVAVYTCSLKHNTACFRPFAIFFIQSVYPFRVSDLAPTVKTGFLLTRPLIVLLFAASINSGARSQTEVTQGTLGRWDASIERTASLLLERDQLGTSLSDSS